MDHLNTLLMTIRKIHQVLVKERHPERMIRKISHIFSETRGYTSVWIALIDQEGRLEIPSTEKSNTRFHPLMDLVREGEMTECMKISLSQKEPLAKGRSIPQCANCRTRAVCPLLKGMMVALRSEEKVYGLMAVTLPGYIAVDQEEIDLFFELAEDISFCLGSLEMERERAKAEEALGKSEERYRILVESAPDAVLVEQGEKLVYINPAGLEILGYESLEELSGKGIGDIWKEKKCRRESGCDFGEPCLWDGKFLQKDGNRIHVELSCVTSTYEGKGALQIMARDVTEVKSLREKTRRMEHLAYLGELSATLAHEIRNPLSSIGLNFRNLMESKLFFETNRKTLENIQRAISRIESIINNVLDYSRPSQPHFKKSDLSKVLKSSLKFTQEEFSKKNIQIIQDLKDNSEEVWMDSSQIFQVLSNLFINAIHAMSEGGILKIRIYPEGDFMALQIEDNGKGIPQEHMERIFKPFFTTKTEGTGLGLAVVSRILEQHHCTITVESEMDQGTTFTLKFPLKEFVY